MQNSKQETGSEMSSKEQGNQHDDQQQYLSSASHYASAGPMPPHVNGSIPTSHVPSPSLALHGSSTGKLRCLVSARIPWNGKNGRLFLYDNCNNHNPSPSPFTPSPLAYVFGTRADKSPFKSTSLEAMTSPNETLRDRAIRGASVPNGFRVALPTDTGVQAPHQRSPSNHLAHSIHNMARGSLVLDVDETSSASTTLPVLVRIHSACFTGENLCSSRCDCGHQLEKAIAQIQKESGILIYLQQEGRGIGLAEKLKAYNLIDMGFDTLDANIELGHQADEREYSVAASILADLGIPSIRLLTNNPDKIEQIERYGIHVAGRVPILHDSWSIVPKITAGGPDVVDSRQGEEAPLLSDLDKYLHTKAMRMNHLYE